MKSKQTLHRINCIHDIMNNFNYKKFSEHRSAHFLILFIFYSLFTPSTQDLYKLAEDERASLYETELVKNGKTNRYTRQANDVYDLSGIQQSSQCGLNNDNNKGNEITTENGKDWPWMAAILYKYGYRSFCGGSLLNRNYVLTAAHCFKKAGTLTSKDEIVVRLGEYNFIIPDETMYQDIFVAEIKIHDDFDSATQSNDIALIKLVRSVEYNQYIRPVCLPNLVPEPNDTTITAGWGAVEFNGEHSTILLNVELPIIIHEECIKSFASGTSISAESNLCAGGQEKDSCVGDSGGPLLFKEPTNDRWITVGIVSWGISCGDYHPGIYTNVKYYLSWIAKRISDSSL